MASASKSLADGGLGVPSALPPGPWYAPFPHVYGPLFFNLTAAFIRVFVLSAGQAAAMLNRNSRVPPRRSAARRWSLPSRGPAPA
jgi:hypothetical protein